jgi:hypothetical protein
MLKVISFCLYGEDPKYHAGMRANIALAKEHYPGWEVWIYADGVYNSCVGAKRLYQMADSKGASGMFWRPLAAFEPDVEVAIFRDADSRLNAREAAAVNEWLDSDYKYHSIHDHRHHALHPLLGGMWGVRDRLPERLVEPFAERADSPAKWGDDQEYLATHFYCPRSTLHHSSVPLKCFATHVLPLTVELPNGQFCGQQYEADGTPIFPR